MAIHIITEKCVGCGACISVCPFSALVIEDNKAVALSSCTLCGLCVDACGFGAIEKPQRTEAVAGAFDDHRGVWVFVQTDSGGIHHVALELVNEGRVLADELGTELVCMVLGDDIDGVVEELRHYPVDGIVTVSHPVLATYRTRPCVDAAVTLIIAPEVEAILESRRILEENLKRVIRDAENGAPRFHHGENGHYLAMQRQGHVTFWVAYSAAEDGYVVHNAYAHRMEVLGP